MLEDFQVDEADELKDEVTEIPKEVRKLRTQQYDKSIIDLMGMIERKEILLRPSFQRNAVWDNKRASLLIESIWLNIPIPQIFVSVEEDGMWNVIDGQQRLTSLMRFFDNDFKLRGLEVLSELNGVNYSSLEDKPQRLLHGGNIRIVAIHEDSHPDIKFDVFMRINQGAIQLNAQELRNCLYRGNLNDALHEMATNPQLLKILNLSKPHNRFKDVEMILRYLAVSESSHENFSNYPGVMKTFLNQYMLKHREVSESAIQEISSNFTETLEKVYEIFGEESFKKWDVDSGAFDSKINLSLMDCQMIAVEEYCLDSIRVKKDILLENFKEIFRNENNNDFFESITSGTSSKIKLTNRINFIKELFSSATS
jgi:hypothetical protein